MLCQRLVVGAGILLWASRTAGASAQERDSISALAVRLASLTAVTGYEQSMVDTILHLLPGSTRDRAGDALLQLGAGSAKRLAVCPLDEPGYVVGNVRDDGYLTLRRAPGKVSPLFDQQIEGQRVTVHGTRQAVPGVVAVRSIHLTRGREVIENQFTADDAFVDVGAETRTQVAALGVAVLSPVALAKRPHRYGSGRLLAAPAAGRRAACAALLMGARQSTDRRHSTGAVTVAFTVEQELAQRGLATVANALGPFEETLIVDGRPGARGELQRVPDPEISARWPGLGRVTMWSMPVSYPGTAVETVSMADADALREALAKWIGGTE